MTAAAVADERVAAIVRSCLDEIDDPCSVAAGMPIGIDGMGMVDAVDVRDGHVRVDIRLTSPGCYMLGYFMDEIEQRVLRLAGVREVEVRFDAGMAWDPTMMREDVRRRRAERLRARGQAATSLRG